MQYIFTRTFVKLYIIQINKSISCFDYKNNLNIKNNNVNNTTLKTNEHSLNIINNNNIDNDLKLKKLIIYNNKIFSRIEIMGIITFVYIKENYICISIDDSTGIINCIIFNNYFNKDIYESIECKCKLNIVVNVYGTIDIYNNEYQLLIDNVVVVNNSKEEIIFLKLLQNNQESIFRFDNNNLDLKNKYFSMIYNKSLKVDKDAFYNIHNDDTMHTYIKTIKEFSNLIMAFFQNLIKSDDNDNNIITNNRDNSYKVINKSLNDCSNYKINKDRIFVEYEFEELFKDIKFKNLFNYISDVEDERVLLIDCLKFLEEHNIGQYYIKNNRDTLKLDIDTSKTTNYILSLFNNLNEVKYIKYDTLYNHLLIFSGNLFNSKYIKFILTLLVNQYKLIYDYDNDNYSLNNY